MILRSTIRSGSGIVALLFLMGTSTVRADVVDADRAEQQTKETIQTPVPEKTQTAEKPAEPPAETAAPTAKADESKRDGGFPERYINRIKAITDVIEENSPTVLEVVSPDQEQQMVNAFVRGLNNGVKLVRASSPEPATIPQTPAGDPMRGVLIADNHVLYMRLDSLAGTSFEQLQLDCQMSSRLANPPWGILLDLRSCGGTEYENALKAAAFFCSEKQLSALQNIKHGKQEFDLPVMVLVGRKTLASGEVLARLLLDARKGMTIGEKTAGRVFPVKKVGLDKDWALLLPVRPKALAKLSAAPINPLVNLTAYPQTSFSDIGKAMDEDSRDTCLHRAVDLLISLHALKSKWK